jgi:membrane fusion protein, adhesin transport system
MTRLDALLSEHPLPSWRFAAWPIMALLAVLLVWADFARLDQVAVAVGEVVPQGKVKIIQHLEGGIIERIHVTEGSVVRAGDPLVRLDLATSGVNRKELLARLDGSLLRRARLLAESGSGALSFPAEAARRQPNVAEAERQAFGARRGELESGLGALREQMRQRELEVQELEAKRRSGAANLALARERLKMSESLLQDGLTARMEHLRLQAEVESLEGELQVLGPALPRARAAVAEAGQRIKENEARFQRQAREEVGEAEQTIARVQELLAEATDQGVRADIKSPIDGVVKKLRYNTLGGVVTPGEAIMEIVPTGDKLVVTAKLSPIDRGYVDAGQSAVVKVSTYDYVRYGGMAGTVTQVAPDATVDKNGQTYFEVVVETERSYLGNEAGRLPITPGMQATVDIHTGSRTVMQPHRDGVPRDACSEAAQRGLPGALRLIGAAIARQLPRRDAAAAPAAAKDQTSASGLASAPAVGAPAHPGDGSTLARRSSMRFAGLSGLSARRSAASARATPCWPPRSAASIAVSAITSRCAWLPPNRWATGCASSIASTARRQSPRPKAISPRHSGTATSRHIMPLVPPSPARRSTRASAFSASCSRPAPTNAIVACTSLNA